MPTYEYACTACGHELDAVQKFSDDPLTICPECGGALRKVYGAVGIAFKGSGFYKTDSRSSGSKAKEGDGSKETTKTETKADTTTKSDAPSTPSTKESKTPASTSTSAS